MVDIGEKIKRRRLELNLTLEQLSEKTGLSKSFLSQIERDIANPSVGTLYAIADVLGISIATLVGGESAMEVQSQPVEKKVTTVVRADGRKVIIYPGSGIRTELLTPVFDRNIQMMRVIMPPGTDSGDVPFSHQGEECGIILQGTLETWIGDCKDPTL